MASSSSRAVFILGIAIILTCLMSSLLVEGSLGGDAAHAAHGGLEVAHHASSTAFDAKTTLPPLLLVFLLLSLQLLVMYQ